MFMPIFKAKELLGFIFCAALLSACSTVPEPLTPEQLAKSARDDLAEIFKDGEPLGASLSISEAIARALKYNLDRRSKAMEEALALNQTNIDHWDMLPKLVTNAGFTSRSVPNATTSRDLYSQNLSKSNPTYSTDPDNFTADLGLSWNILDFGLSYFTAKQNADRALIATERKRKAIHFLVQEVRFAFWRAAAYQELKSDVETTMAEARVALDRARIVEQENLKAPMEALYYQKSLLETLRQLSTIQQELSSAQIELKALINAPMRSEIILDVPEEMQVPKLVLSLEEMEELAFFGNADLREQEYQTRITVYDTKRAITNLLPGITFSTSLQYDHNSLLAANNWYDAGIKLSWNLLNILSAPDILKYAEMNEEVAKTKRLAQRMAVLAQVHVAELQFYNMVDQFNQSDELWKIDARLHELSVAKQESDADGMLERVASKASAITSQTRRFQAYALVEQAFGKIQTTIGQDLLPDSVSSYEIKDLSEVIARKLAEWAHPKKPVEVSFNRIPPQLDLPIPNLALYELNSP